MIVKTWIKVKYGCMLLCVECMLCLLNGPSIGAQVIFHISAKPTRHWHAIPQYLSENAKYNKYLFDFEVTYNP